MVLTTFETDFLKEISFSKDGRIYMKGTNMLKCWIGKFYASTLNQLNKAELKDQNNNIAKTIQETIRRLKNTKSKK